MLKYPKINFVGNLKIFLLISGIVIFLVMICSIFIGPRLDIKFKGGTIITYSYTGDVTENDIIAEIDSAISQKPEVQQSVDFATGSRSLIITLASSNDLLNSDVVAETTTALTAAFSGNNFERLSDSSVSPTMGKNFFLKSLVAIILAFALIVVFIAFRFKNIGGWSAGICSIIALMHDVIIVFGVFVIFSFSINDNFIAAVLTILGYSINGTIVVFDRIRENQTLSNKNATVREIVNTSINQTLSRSINTTLAAILAMAVVCIVSFLFGVTSIMSFAFPMVVGMISGAYSSSCISGPIWVVWQNRKNKKDTEKSSAKNRKHSNLTARA